jgi:hypothetical protein
MVARLTPDQKVACSIHVGFKIFAFFFFFFYLFIYLFIYFFLNYHKSNQKRRMYVHPLESESEIPNIYKRKKKKILGLLLIY